MRYIDLKRVFKVGICSFCDNIQLYDSLDEGEFLEKLRKYLEEKDIQSYLEDFANEALYNLEDIDHVCGGPLYSYNFQWFKINYAIMNCLRAFRRTIRIDKTICVEAFVDNLAREFLDE